MKSLPWKRAETMLNHEKNRMVFCARIERREDLYEWIGPVYSRTISLYKLKSRSDIKINGLEDVMRYKIGVVRGYASVTELLKIGILDENLERTVDETLNIRKLYGNRFDLIPNNDMVFSYNLQNEGHSLDDMEKVFEVTQAGVSDYHFALNKETSPALAEKLRSEPLPISTRFPLPFSKKEMISAADSSRAESPLFPRILFHHFLLESQTIIEIGRYSLLQINGKGAAGK